MPATCTAGCPRRSGEWSRGPLRDRFVSPAPFVYEGREAAMPRREREINASRRAFIACSLAGGVALTLPITAGEAQDRRQPMEMTIRANSGVMTLINVFAVDPENQQRLVAVLKEGTEALMSKRAGYISASIHASKDGRRVVNYSQWRSVKDIEAMRQHPDVGPYMKRVAGLGTFEAIACEVSFVHQGAS
jgi:quinol monooxygenase YgiN